MLLPVRLAAIAGLLLPNFAIHGEAPALFERAPVVSRELSIGEPMPDVPLRGGDGRELRLRDFRGKAVAVTFFYSRCNAATFCPLVGQKFDAAQALLTRMGAAKHCHLLSISLDPERDTSEMLSAYAKGFGADAGIWTFATGSVENIRKLGEAIGLEYQRVGDRIDHNLRTVILDGDGCIRRVLRGDGWTPQELAADLNAAARQYR
jgi:protein SCO1/2